jgi:hypothetical protein
MRTYLAKGELDAAPAVVDVLSPSRCASIRSTVMRQSLAVVRQAFE